MDWEETKNDMNVGGLYEEYPTWHCDSIVKKVQVKNGI